MCHYGSSSSNFSRFPHISFIIGPKQSLQIPTTWSTIRATHAIHVLMQHTNKSHNPTNKCSNTQKRRMPFSPLTIHECLPSSWFADSHWPLNSLTIILWFASSPFTIELVPHLANFEGCSLGGRCIHPLLQEEWNICWRPLACSHNYCSCLFCHLAVVDHCGRLLHVVWRGITLNNLFLCSTDPALKTPESGKHLSRARPIRDDLSYQNVADFSLYWRLRLTTK